MTVLVAAPEPTASRVDDVLTDRTVTVTSTVADGRDRLADGPTVVIVAAHLPDETGPDLLAAVRSGEHCPPETPVLELVESDDADAGATDDGSSGSAGPSASSGPDSIVFDARVSLADPDTLRKAVRLAVAVGEYREATTALYDLSRRRADGESIDATDLADARRAANDRLTAVQRAADGQTPFRQLLSE